jgi:hypothetical protein
MTSSFRILYTAKVEITGDLTVTANNGPFGRLPAKGFI